MIIFNFDVLAQPHKDVALRHPTVEGASLWRMFFEHYMGRIVLVVNEDYKDEHLEHWLKMNGYKPAIIEMMGTRDPSLKADKVQLLMSTTGRLDWYLDIDPNTAKETMSRGIPTLLVALPYIVRPEWSGEQTTRQWGEITAEIDRQAIMKADKTWGDPV